MAEAKSKCGCCSCSRDLRPTRDKQICQELRRQPGVARHPWIYSGIVRHPVNTGGNIVMGFLGIWTREKKKKNNYVFVEKYKDKKKKVQIRSLRKTTSQAKTKRMIFLLLILLFLFWYCSKTRYSQLFFLSSDRYGLRDLLTNDCLTVLSGSRAGHQRRLGGEKSTL